MKKKQNKPQLKLGIKSKNFIKKALDNYFSTAILIIGTYWVLSDAIWTILNIIDYYCGNKLFNKWFLWLLVVALPLLITLSYYFFNRSRRNYKKQAEENKKGLLNNIENLRFQRNIIAESFDTIFQYNPDALKKEILTARDNKDWEQVINIGKHGARLFLMFEKYELRKEYGEYIIEAAQEIKDVESEAMGFIDCVGWSLVKQGDHEQSQNQVTLYKEATDKITEGLNKIVKRKTENANILKCKAARHLIGIALRQNDMNTAGVQRQAFEEALKKLKGENHKIMQASLHIIDAEIALKDPEKDFEKTKKLYEAARQIYISCSDDERAVKIYNKLGEADMLANQDHKAIKNFLIGFWISEKLGRDDEKLKNCKKIVELIQKKPNILKEVYKDKFKKQLEDLGITNIKDNVFYTEQKKTMEQKIHP